MIRAAQRVIAVSEFTAREMEELVGVPTDLIRLVTENEPIAGLFPS